MNRKRQEKFADLLLDVVKYIITAGLLAALFSDFGRWEWYAYVLLAISVVFVTAGGLYLYEDEEKKNVVKND